MKLALDFHGVIDTNFKAFSELTNALMNTGNEVHILTGSPISLKFIEQLTANGIVYTHLFSITDYHQTIGTKIEWDQQGNPHLDPYLWDRTKGEYCFKNQIDLCLDDSDIYSYFFKTPYARYFSKGSGRVQKIHIT